MFFLKDVRAYRKEKFLFSILLVRLHTCSNSTTMLSHKAKDIAVVFLDFFTAAINFLRSLLEPDPAKRPNIQQALANRWLNENYPGRAPPNVTYPNRYCAKEWREPARVYIHYVC